MPHFRERHVVSLYQKLIGASPIVGVFGHRQVGKSTFLAASVRNYRTLDDQRTRQNVHDDPAGYIAGSSLPMALDECQIEPRLFPALKEWVRVHKRPGQFILSGSVRFTSRRAIRESLAGRLMSMEMLPLVLSELRQEELPDIVPRLLRVREFTESSLHWIRERGPLGARLQSFEKYLLQGGLPGLCFLREERLRNETLRDLHRLMLDRDLRLVVETRISLERLAEYLRILARGAWNPYSASEVKRRIGLSHQTQSALLYAFESIFLIRRIPLVGRRGELVFFEDQYEERLLSDGELQDHDQVLSAVYRNVRAQFQYRLGQSLRVESFWLPTGARVPLVLRTPEGVLGLMVVEGKPGVSEMRSAHRFLSGEPAGKVVFVERVRRDPELMDSRMLICSVAALL